MKRFTILLMLLVLPMLAFADFQLGPTALFNMLLTAPPAVSNLDRSFGLEDFTFGLDSRLNIGLFQGSAYALFTPGKFIAGAQPEVTPHIIDVKLDVGICLDILFLRLGLGIGPNFQFLIAPSADPIATAAVPDPIAVGLNLKVAADLNLGSIAVSVVYFTDTNLTASAVAASLSKWNGKLGLSLLFKLF